MKKELLTFLFAAITLCAQAQVAQGFEELEDFSVDDIRGWTFHDLDGGTTYDAAADGNWTNENYVGTAIVFNSSQTTPPLDVFATRTGEKGLYFFSSGANSTTHPNDDWAIMPQISLGDSSSFSMWAKSLTHEYGAERFEIAVSTTGTEVADFTVISGEQPYSVPEDWTEYQIDLSDYDNQSIYIAIHYVSDDAYVLMTDDYILTSSNLGTIDMLNEDGKLFQIFPNPVGDLLNIELADKFSKGNVSLTIFNTIGEKVVSQSYVVKGINVANLSSGVYFLELTDGKTTETRKFIKQ